MPIPILFKPGSVNADLITLSLIYILYLSALYSTAQLAFKYLSYYLGAYNAKGHGVHSPFVFDFITNVLNDKSYDPCYDLLEGQRRLLLKNDHVISVQDYGAGSSSGAVLFPSGETITTCSPGWAVKGISRFWFFGSAIVIVWDPAGIGMGTPSATVSFFVSR